MDKISIIMPLYNCEGYVRHTIRSVQQQTYKNWELIIVDDASTDNSLQVVKDFAAKDARIKVFPRAVNTGTGACRNYGLDRAEGRFVAFIDSDDLWAEEKLHRQIAFMKNHNYALSHTAYAFMDMNGDILQQGKVDVDETVDRNHYMKTTQVGMSSVMIDRDKIKNIRFPEDRRLCEDATLWMQFLRQGHKFHGLNEILLLYRVSPRQLSRNKSKMAMNTLKRYWKEKDLPAYKRLFYFMNYAYNGVKKRIEKSEVPQSVAQNFIVHHCSDGKGL
ncbi:MAG: glycosyltransferase family 2 protein [Alphaproteobacteria bacterium]|nr:glycosyltransferase family 2 protein [Alphaproteobacteria bacterium]